MVVTPYGKARAAISESGVIKGQFNALDYVGAEIPDMVGRFNGQANRITSEF